MSNYVSTSENSFIKAEPVLARHLVAALAAAIVAFLVTHGVITATQASVVTQVVVSGGTAVVTIGLAFLNRVAVTPAVKFGETVEAAVDSKLSGLFKPAVLNTWDVPAAGSPAADAEASGDSEDEDATDEDDDSDALGDPVLAPEDGVDLGGISGAGETPADPAKPYMGGASTPVAAPATDEPAADPAPTAEEVAAAQVKADEATAEQAAAAEKLAAAQVTLDKAAAAASAAA